MQSNRPHPGLRTNVVLAMLAACAFCTRAAGQDAAAPAAPRSAFEEIWAYLVRGEESRLAGTEPITDICYVGAYLSRNGRIVGSIPRPAVTTRGGTKPRIHLVVPETANMALTHFAVDPRYGVRPLLIDDIIRVAQDFDGVQIDFEAVARDDAGAFHDFLRALRLALPAEKTLSIAVPARTKTIADAWEYARIATIVDRMVIMAYDEHWSTSSPGPVASPAWCTSVADFAKTAIPAGKIIMGLPLYGRAWQDKQLARALRFENVQDLVEQTGSEVGYESATGASFSYTETVVVSVFFEDARSLGEKLGLYQARGIPAVSFWRVGQGPPELWNSMDIRERATSGETGSGAATGPSAGAP
jgi:spore germination protein